jgi:hypothetical protein
MTDEEKHIYISNEFQKLSAVFSILPGIHDPNAKLPRPESDLSVPKRQFMQAFKYMAACVWMPSEGVDENLSAREVKRRFILETAGKTYDGSAWPKYATNFFLNALISAKYIGEFFPASEVARVEGVSRDDVFEWEQQRFDGLQDPNSPCRVIAEAKDNVCLEILDFLISVEHLRSQEFDKYWPEVHRKLGMPPPAFTRSSGCLSLFLVGLVVSTTVGSIAHFLA